MAMDLCVRRVEGMYVDSSIFQKKRRGNVWIDVPSICKSRIEKNEEEICIHSRRVMHVPKVYIHRV